MSKKIHITAVGVLATCLIAVVKALNVIAGTSAERTKLRDYASQHGFGIVLETVYYAKPQFTITDITADVLALPH